MSVKETVTANVVLPNEHYTGMWDSIVATDEEKGLLLRWALLSLRLRGALGYQATALHGVVVLYGPPGTGKTTMARGLAQTLVPLAPDRRVRLIEVTPHGLMSGEHGQSQQNVSMLLTEYVPGLAEDGMPTVVLLDEVESMAVARSEASLSANPADIHRATDAVLMALDQNAVQRPNLLFVATSNFVGALDSAFLSRADVAIRIPLPDREAIVAILAKTLTVLAAGFPDLLKLAEHSELPMVADLLSGCDGRQVRKAVTESMAGRLDVVKDPNKLSISDLLGTAKRIAQTRAYGAADAEA